MPRRRKVKAEVVEKKEAVEIMVDNPINPFALSAAFLNYCIEKGWLIRKQKGNATAYYLTKRGRRELPKIGVDISDI